MESFVTLSARPRAEAGGGDRNVQNDVLEKLRRLRLLDLKSLKLAIEHELKTGPPSAVLTLQANCSATTSECWNFFSRVMERGSGSFFAASGREYVACRACFRAYAYESGKGTSSLNNHIKNCSVHDANAAAGSIVGFAVPQPVSAKLKRQVSRAAAIMCCKDLRPFSTVEGEGFKLLASTLLDIGAKTKVPIAVHDLLPVANTVKNHVVKVAKHSRTGVQNMLVVHFDSGHSAGFTVDLWTDKARKLSFVSITVHFIDDLFKLHARTLQVQHFEARSHTAQAVLQYFDDCLRSYHIYDRRMLTVVSDSTENMHARGLVTVVTDSGSNMSGSCGFRSQYDWIACADHKISTVLTTILCKTTETVDKVRSEPFYKFRRDAPQVFDLIDACKTLVRYVKQANLQHELSNITRWGSQFRMLSSVLEMFDELAEMLTARQRLSYLQSIDRSLLDELVRFLAHFQESTLKLECWRKPTLHLVAFEKYRLVELLKPQRESVVLPADDDGQAETIPPDSESLIVVKQLILTHSLSTWNVTEKHIVAAMLDPRQKTGFTYLVLKIQSSTMHEMC